MSKQGKAFTAGLAGALALAVALVLGAGALGAAEGAKEGGSSQPAIERVDPTTVCMVNDQAMGKPQIPVEVESKTYYGCCEMCKQRLAQDEAIRFAIDPVTGERVDKASAVIGELADGRVLYFASVETLERYGKE
jgi:YHS domain-containing protein